MCPRWYLGDRGGTLAQTAVGRAQLHPDHHILLSSLPGSPGPSPQLPPGSATGPSGDPSSTLSAQLLSRSDSGSVPSVLHPGCRLKALGPSRASFPTQPRWGPETGTSSAGVDSARAGAAFSGSSLVFSSVAFVSENSGLRLRTERVLGDECKPLQGRVITARNLFLIGTSVLAKVREGT